VLEIPIPHYSRWIVAAGIALDCRAGCRDDREPQSLRDHRRVAGKWTEKDIEVEVTDGNLIIKGEKQEEKEEKQKDYYLHERHFGSFNAASKRPASERPEESMPTKSRRASKKGVLTGDAAEEARGAEASKEGRGEGSRLKASQARGPSS
jgi:Hsp20/alpha crystallin family